MKVEVKNMSLVFETTGEVESMRDVLALAKCASHTATVNPAVAAGTRFGTYTAGEWEHLREFCTSVERIL